MGCGDALHCRHRRRHASAPGILHRDRSRCRVRPRRTSRRGFAFRAAPSADRDRDPRSIHGGWLWRAQARARSALHSVVWHRHRVKDSAGFNHRLLHRLFQRAGRHWRARRRAGPDGAGYGRDRAPCGAPHRVSRRSSLHLRGASPRHAICDRRRDHRRANLGQSRARLSDPAQRNEFRHDRNLCRARCYNLYRVHRQLERRLLRWRPVSAITLQAGT